MVRTALDVLLALAAVALLGALILLSTASNDAQRRVDQSLRHMRDIATAMEREIDNMRNFNIDRSAQIAALGDGLDAVLKQTARDMEDAFPGNPPLIQTLRANLVTAFNSIGGNSEYRLQPDRVARVFSVVSEQSGKIRVQARDYATRHLAFRSAHDAVTEASWAFVQELRERRLSTQADALFRSTGQVLQRLDRGAESELFQIEAILELLEKSLRFQSAEDHARLNDLMSRFRGLGTLRRQLDNDFKSFDSSQYTRQVELLRDRISRDYLFHLSVTNDSRVLLNIYTALLLVVLGYFGQRLQRSYRELNASHAALETMNVSLEERVRSRTEDLEAAYNELKESQIQLVQAEKMSSLGQLVAGVMHEINTPLLYVLNNQSTTAENIRRLRALIDQAVRVVESLKAPGPAAENLKAELQRLREALENDSAVEIMEEVDVLARDSQDGLHQISELVQSLKDFSRLDRAGEDAFDVREGIEKTLTITRNLWKCGVEVIREFEDIPEIFCSPSKINQVFINLVTNAIQAMDGKGVLTIRTRNRGNWVHVEVEDTGCGIPQENLHKIMDPFFTTKPVGQGTGLGMSIAKKIVDDHGGHLEVESELGIGTKFIIRLPVLRKTSAVAA